MIFLRKSVWPLREVISGLQRTESSLIKESTGIYLRDVYDHSIQVIDTIETFRDMISGMLDIYLSSISNKMNEVMKVLTIIATYIYSPNFYCWYLWNEFRVYPRTSIALGIFCCLVYNGSRKYYYANLFQEEKMAVGRKEKGNFFILFLLS